MFGVSKQRPKKSIKIISRLSVGYKIYVSASALLNLRGYFILEFLDLIYSSLFSLFYLDYKLSAELAQSLSNSRVLYGYARELI